MGSAAHGVRVRRMLGGAVKRQTSVPWEKINEFLLACGEVHEPYRFCLKVLEEIRALVDYDECVLLMLDKNRKIVRKHFSFSSKRLSAMYMEYFSRSIKGDFALDREVYEVPDSSFVRIINWGDLKVTKENADFLHTYIKALGLRSSLTFVFFDLGGSPATAFSLDRTKKKPFSERDLHTVSVAIAHLNNLYKNMFVRPPKQVRIWDGASGSDELTPRERDVVELISQGVTPANISRELHISLGTTNKHISHIYKKLGVGSRQELLVRLLGR